MDDSKIRAFARRRMLQGAGGLIAAATLPAAPLSAAQPTNAPAAARPAGAEITGRLARYMVEARTRTLPPAVLRNASTASSTRSARWSPARGSSPARWRSATCAAQGGVAEASVLATNFRTTAVNAALANAMFAHADETDDFEPVTKAHPGCAVVPAALAIGERERRIGHGLDPRGRARLRPLLPLADGARSRPRARHPSQRRRHELHLRRRRRRRWHGPARRDRDARTRCPTRRSRSRACGAGCATRTTSRRRSTSPAWARATASPPSPWCRLGSPASRTCSTASTTCSWRSPRSRSRRRWSPASAARFFVTETAIKTFSVGYPIQAPLDAFLTLRRQHNLTPANVERILVRLPADGAASSTTARCPT